MITLPLGVTQQAAEGGGVPYAPGMMTFADAAFYESASANATFSGNAVTCLYQHNTAPFTGQGLTNPIITKTSGNILVLYAISSDYAATPSIQSKLVCQVFNSSAAVICQLVSTVDYDTSLDQSVFFSYDATAGTAIFEIDGVDVIDPSSAAPFDKILTTGTLLTGSGIVSSLGSETDPYASGDMGFIGIDDTYQSTPSDFFDGAAPKELDQVTWTEFGAQPMWFNEFGTMTDNKGTEPSLVVNGTITGPS